MSSIFRKASGLVLVLFGMMGAANGSESVSVERESSIQGLEISGGPLSVEVTQSNGKKVRTVRLRGTYTRSGWKLGANKKLLANPSKGKSTFEIPIIIQKKNQEFVVLAIGPQKAREREKLVLHWQSGGRPPQAATKKKKEAQQSTREESREEVTTSSGEKKMRLSVAAKAHLLSYTETNVSNFSGFLIRPSVEFWWHIFKKLELWTSADYDVFSVSSSPATYSVSFLELWGYLGYRIAESTKWQWVAGPGLGFINSTGSSTTTIAGTTGTSFGFKGLLSYSLDTEFRYSLSDKHSLAVHARYAPVFGLGLGDRNLFFGATYYYRFRSGSRALVSLGISKLDFVLTTGTVGSSSTLIGVGYQF